MNEPSQEAVHERGDYPDRNDDNAKDQEQRLQSQYRVEDGVELIDHGPSSVEYTHELSSTFDASIIVSHNTIVQVVRGIDSVLRQTAVFIIQDDW